MAHRTDRKINIALAAVAISSIALMVLLSIHGMDERAKAREIARLPVVTFEAVTIVSERAATTPQATQMARTPGITKTLLR